MKPEIAIVVLTRNRCALLKKVIESIEAQTFRDFTLYVSDNGSTDDTRLLSEKDFPNLNLVWIRRQPGFPDIRGHYNAIVSEITEPYCAIAHDDEVYSPDWIETLVAMVKKDPSCVLAAAQTLIVDARTSQQHFYKEKGEFPPGTYTHRDVIEHYVIKRQHISGNGFLFSTAAGRNIAPFDAGYEQYDLEWLFRLTTQGTTAVSAAMLNTYTLHRSNTVTSPAHLKHYVHSIHAAEMQRNLLASTGLLDSIEGRKISEELSKSQVGGEFRVWLKIMANGAFDEAGNMARRILRNPYCTLKHRLILTLITFTPLAWPASKLIAQLRNSYVSRPVPPRTDWIPVTTAEASAIFPNITT